MKRIPIYSIITLLLIATVPWGFVKTPSGSLLGFPPWAIYSLASTILLGFALTVCLRRYWKLSESDEDFDGS